MSKYLEEEEAYLNKYHPDQMVDFNKRKELYGLDYQKDKIRVKTLIKELTQTDYSKISQIKNTTSISSILKPSSSKPRAHHRHGRRVASRRVVSRRVVGQRRFGLLI